MRDGITDLHLLRTFYTGDDIADITCRQLFTGSHIKFQHTDLVSMIFLAGRYELHEIVSADRTIHNLVVGDDAAERIEYGIENKSL